MNAENRKPQRGLKNVKVNQSGVMFCALDAYCSQDFVSINIGKITENSKCKSFFLFEKHFSFQTVIYRTHKLAHTWLIFSEQLRITKNQWLKFSV